MMQINEPGLEAALDTLADRQPVPVSRRAMAIAILEAAVRRWDATGDPEGWRYGSEADAADGLSGACGAS